MLSKWQMAKCPHCGAEASLGKENRWRPFCSERCKLVDLGSWLSGSYRIPGDPVDPQALEPVRKPDDVEH